MTDTIKAEDGEQRSPLAELRESAVLPDWLRLLAQPERVRSALAQSIPPFASGELTLRDCQISRVRMKKGVWNALCSLTVEEPQHKTTRQIATQATLFPPDYAKNVPASSDSPLGSVEWRWYLPELRLVLEGQPPEQALPSLSYLTDPAEARETLEQAMRGGDPSRSALRILSAAPHVLRYKPGSRCTIRYHLTYPPDQRIWPAQVIAKTYKGDKGREVFAGMRALWQSPLSHSNAVHIAEPLGFLPELNVLIQGPVPGEQNLKDLLRSALQQGTDAAFADLSASMGRASAGLAALHTSGALYGKTSRWEDARDDVAAVIQQLVDINPTLAAAATSLLERMEAQAARFPPDPLAPTHGSFRPDQVLLAGDEVSFIDFDKFGQAEPALDLALFLSATKNIGLSKPHEEESDEEDLDLDPQGRRAVLDRLDFMCASFMHEYARNAPVSPERVALWEALNLLELVLECWVKVKPVRLSNTLLMLERYLADGQWTMDD